MEVDKGLKICLAADAGEITVAEAKAALRELGYPEQIISAIFDQE